MIMITDDGVIIRINSDDITAQSRYGSGVRVMRVPEGGRIVTLARVPKEEEESTDSSEEKENAEQTEEKPENAENGTATSGGIEEKLSQAVQDFADFALEQQDTDEKEEE